MSECQCVSECQSVRVSRRHSARVSGCHSVTASQCHSAMVSECQSVSMSGYHGVTVSRYQGIRMSCVRVSGCHSVTASQYQSVRVSGCQEFQGVRVSLWTVTQGGGSHCGELPGRNTPAPGDQRTCDTSVKYCHTTDWIGCNNGRLQAVPLWGGFTIKCSKCSRLGGRHSAHHGMNARQLPQKRKRTVRKI